jgi:hypothetical protein
MTPNDPPTKKPVEVLNIVAVKNGWMLYEYDDRTYHDNGCIRRPTYVFNSVADLLSQVRELLVPPGK